MAYHPKSLRCLSKMQICLGSISLFLGIASAVLKTDFTSIIGFGIWVGFWIIIAGRLGLSGTRDRQVPNQCLLGTFMGFTITACVMAGTMIICYSIALDGLAYCIREWQEWNRYTTYYYEYRSSYYCYDILYGSYYSLDQFKLSRVKAGIGIDSVLLTIAVLEFAVGLASSIFCCAAMCSCCNGTSRVQGTQQVVYIQPAMGQVSTAGDGVVLMSGGPQGTVVQPPAGQFIVQQPAQVHKEYEPPPAYN